jgi:hypothetical protein
MHVGVLDVVRLILEAISTAHVALFVTCGMLETNAWISPWMVDACSAAKGIMQRHCVHVPVAMRGMQEMNAKMFLQRVVSTRVASKKMAFALCAVNVTINRIHAPALAVFIRIPVKIAARQRCLEVHIVDMLFKKTFAVYATAGTAKKFVFRCYFHWM